MACAVRAGFMHGSKMKTVEAAVRVSPTAPERTDSKKTVMVSSALKAFRASCRSLEDISPVSSTVWKLASVSLIFSLLIVWVNWLKMRTLTDESRC